MSGYLPRLAQQRLDLFVRGFRVVIVNGPRQAGKTTLLRLFQRSHGGSLRSLDEATTLATAVDDPRGFAEFGNYPRIIDEIQRGGDALVRAIKFAVDQDDRRGQFVLSGSTRFLTVPNLSESLAGRAVFVDLWPFAVVERVAAEGDFCSRLFRDAGALVRAAPPSQWTRAQYLDLVCAGGYPEAVTLPAGPLRRGWFEAYLQTVVQRDIRGFADIQHGAVVPRMLGLLAARSGSPAVTADMARSVELNQMTVRNYLAYLDTVFLTATCLPFSTNLTSRLTKAPKVFLTDSGLAAHVLGVDAQDLAEPGHPALGGIVETFVFAELTRLLAQEDRGINLMHLRDRDGREVDFVLERHDGQVVTIEVKAAQTVRSADLRHLQWLRDRLGERFQAGVVLYLGPDTHPFGDRLFAAPLSALWHHKPLPGRAP